MGIFDIFRKPKEQQPPKDVAPKQQQPNNVTPTKQPTKLAPTSQLLEMPEYNMYLEFLDMAKGRTTDYLFIGNTSLVPEDKRNELQSFFEQCLNDGWIYETEGKESVSESFTKNDFVKVLKENNLSISGNKIDLVERIDSNIGLEKFYNTGQVKNKSKLTDLGKLKLKEYRSDFTEEYNLFKQSIHKLFELNKISEACNNVTAFKESYPFDRSELFITFSGDSLFERCKIYKTTDVLKKIGIPDMYREAILNTYCMHFSFADFDYKKEIEEIYNGFTQLLIDSDLVKNKDIPFFDLEHMIYDLKAIYCN